MMMIYHWNEGPGRAGGCRIGQRWIITRGKLLALSITCVLALFPKGKDQMKSRSATGRLQGLKGLEDGGCWRSAPSTSLEQQ